jgi:hypothetical protein
MRSVIVAVVAYHALLCWLAWHFAPELYALRMAMEAQ